MVVLGHNIQYGSGDTFYQMECYFENFFFKLIYSFHMPLFALLSGYLFFWSIKRNVGQVLKKRLTSLLLPIFGWITLECAGRAAILIIDHEFVLINFVRIYANKIIGSLWFMWAIFWCSLIVLLVEKAFKGRIWIYSLILVLILFTPAKYNLHMYAYMYPYFLAGFMFDKFDGKGRYSRAIKKDGYSLVVATVAFVILFMFYNHDSYIYTTKISLLGENGFLVQFGIDIYRWGIGFVGSTVVILVSKIICDKWQGIGVKLFAYFGQISLGIYILNSYTNTYLLQRLTGNFSPNVFVWIYEEIVSMALYTVAVEAIKRIPVAKELLLGGR